jgi:hypothetical protein
MTSVSHEPVPAPSERPSLTELVKIREVAASIAITVMWLAVLFDSIFGPDIVSTSSAPGNSTTVPSGVAVALFATIGSWAVARYAFRRDR